MTICPDCAARLEPDDRCACGWRLELRAGVEVRLGARDRADPVLREYLSNYDAIADEDLDSGILDQDYVANQATNTVRYVGDVAGLSVCDLGCGKGLVAHRLLAKGPSSLTMVDISMPYLRRHVGCGARVVQANAENLPFEDAFDVVVSTDVMEHVLNVGSFLFSLNRALKLGGRAVVRVPFREDLLVYSPHMGCGRQFVHLRTFDRRALTDHLEHAGLRVDAMKFDGFVLGKPRPFWWDHPRRRKAYLKLQAWVNERFGSAAAVTLWPTWLASAFMPPTEIVAVATKVAHLGVRPTATRG